MKQTILLMTIISTFLFSSCKSEEEKELELIQAYITEHDISTAPTESGLYYIETKVGEGDLAVAGNYVTVEYEGRYLDGEIFDSTEGFEPFSFYLGEGNVIKGWDEGISYMKKNGKATFIIPSSLGYGSNDYYSIPGYSTLIFDVELVDIEVK